MTRCPRAVNGARLRNLDEAIPRQEDTLELRLALLRRRCPRCGSYLFREPGRTYCLACSWEHYGGERC